MQAARPYSCRRPGVPAAPRKLPPRAPAYAQATPNRSAARISPDAHPLLRRQVQLVARLHVESLIPRIHVAHRAIDTELRWTVRIAHDQAPQLLLSIERAPRLCPRE